MAEKKETPRQKMIGMMYLVLTALLALNVSKEVLMGFVTVNESLERTNKTFNESTLTLMNYFADYVKKYPDEKVFYDKAQSSAKYTGEMYNYIEAMKKKLVEVTEKRTKQEADTSRLRYVAALDNLDVPTYELFGDDEANPSKKEFSAFELRTKLTETHDKIIALIEDEKFAKKFQKGDIESMKKKISAIKPVDPPKAAGVDYEDWQMSQFYHLPLAAVITNLSKIQSDLRNIESETVNTIAKSVMTTMPKVNDFKAAVVAPSNYIQMGDKYTADIFLATGSSNVKREIFIGDFDTLTRTFRGEMQALQMDASGHAIFEQATGAQGERSYKGAIKMTKDNGEISWYPFEQKYTVAPASVAVSNDDMNVVYGGIENKLSISAAGIAPQNLRVSSSNGTIAPAGSGKYKLTGATPGGEVTINVSAQTENGLKKQGEMKLRVRSLPPPTIKIGGKSQNDRNVSKSVLQASDWVTAQPDNFLLNLSYKVLSYDFLSYNGGQVYPETVTTGGKLTPTIKNNLRRLNPGAKIFITVKSESPDKKIHTNSLFLVVN